MQRNLNRLHAVFLVGFLLVSLTLGYWQFYRQDDLLARPTNPRIEEEARRVIRGRIYDRNGLVLAENVEAEGKNARRYRSPADVAVVGYHSARFGSTGIEGRYDDYLSGARSADPLDRLRTDLFHRPTTGSDVVLTVDARIQQAAIDALGNQIGAIVALDPKTGAVLAMASTPTFNPANIDSRWQQLLDDPNHPLVPRTTEGLYTPGSTFKVVTAAAAIDLNRVNVDEKYRCVDAIKIDNLTVDCRNHQQLATVNYREAFAWSCNRTFALTGLELGLDRLQLADGLRSPFPWQGGIGGSAKQLEEYSGRFGFGRDIPFDLPVAKSQLKGGGEWYPDLLAQTAFGQGEISATPMQMALVAATIGNGGAVPAPYLAIEARAPTGVVTRIGSPGGTLGTAISQRTAATMNELMVLSVDTAYAKPAAVPGVKVGGKTGTAEAGAGGSTPHSWFVGYAPAEDPRVAVAVIMEHRGSGTDFATPAGGAVIKQALDLYRR